MNRCMRICCTKQRITKDIPVNLEGNMNMSVRNVLAITIMWPWRKSHRIPKVLDISEPNFTAVHLIVVKIFKLDHSGGPTDQHCILRVSLAWLKRPSI